MAHVKDVLADQLLANANDPSWYIPFSDAVKDLSERKLSGNRMKRVIV